MKKRFWWWIIPAICLYPLLTWLVLNFYPDDPSHMQWNDREAFNRKYIAQLSQQPEADRQQVINRLGGPDITEAVKVQQDIYQLMYYRTRRAISDGITTKDECSPLLFKNQRLIAIEAQAIEQYQQALKQAS
jgi:hypothetical protein